MNMQDSKESRIILKKTDNLKNLNLRAVEIMINSRREAHLREKLPTSVENLIIIYSRRNGQVCIGCCKQTND